MEALYGARLWMAFSMILLLFFMLLRGSNLFYFKESINSEISALTKSIFWKGDTSSITTILTTPRNPPVTAKASMIVNIFL
jgi:hypothetical protein